jgi:hypothetical protein
MFGILELGFSNSFIASSPLIKEITSSQIFSLVILFLRINVKISSSLIMQIVLTLFIILALQALQIKY